MIQPNHSASSGNAITAARKIFSKVSFIHKTKKEVLSILGEPGTISDYGIKSNKYPNKLVYKFDNGFGGYQYTLYFKDNQCYKVEATGLN